MSYANLQHRAQVMSKHSELELKTEWSTPRNPTSVSHRPSAWWTRLLEKLLDAFRSRAPVGYEDETGFHFGNRPR
jgi:hypothetical protein